MAVAAGAAVVVVVSVVAVVDCWVRIRTDDDQLGTNSYDTVISALQEGCRLTMSNDKRI